MPAARSRLKTIKMTDDNRAAPQTPEKPALELIQFPGTIHLIDNDAKADILTERLRDVTELGFDTETRPSFRKGEVYKTAILQLATDDDAYVIQLQKLSRFDVLKRIFEEKTTLKVGVAIRDDLKKLKQSFPFLPENFVELQDLAKSKGLKNFGLQGMTEEVLNARLSKKAKITNWEARTLTRDQIMYAATDAWVGLELFRKIRAL